MPLFASTLTALPQFFRIVWFGFSHKTLSEYVAYISLNEIVANTTDRFIEALNKFDMKYKEAQQIIRENKLEEDFEEDDDGDM